MQVPPGRRRLARTSAVSVGARQNRQDCYQGQKVCCRTDRSGRCVTPFGTSFCPCPRWTQGQTFSVRTTLSEFVKQVAKNSFLRKGGKPVPEQQVTKLLQLEEEKLQSISALRCQQLLLQYQQEVQLARRPVSGHWQEENAKPLQVMDFEQLKMENQTLNERLVERQEEAQKLQAIARNSAQVSNLYGLSTQSLSPFAFRDKMGIGGRGCVIFATK